MCAGCDDNAAQMTQSIVMNRILPLLPPPSAIDNKLIGGVVCDTNKRRPDVLWVGTDRIVTGEIDEHNHRDEQSACHVAKISDTRFGIQDGEVAPFVMVRFNPDECDHMHGTFDERCARFAAKLLHYITCPVEALDPLRANVYYMDYHSSGRKTHIAAARAQSGVIAVIGDD
jgi:ferredoxin